MEQYGNTTTYNLEIVLKQNIVNSDYYRNDCTKLSTWGEVIDQIYFDVKDVEPWMGGNVRGPSSAFCLLYRLFTLKPTEEEIRDTIRHKDLVFIRAVSMGLKVGRIRPSRRC
jgi:pre-mRNA-splicing factor 38B